METLIGKVQDGKKDASLWLAKFADVYSDWLRQKIFPGSLNIDTGSAFNWHSTDIIPYRRKFSLAPHGGNRDLFIVPCQIVEPGNQHCWLWSTTTAADSRPDPNVIEIIAPVHLRKSMNLSVGSIIKIKYPIPWIDMRSHQTE